MSNYALEVNDLTVAYEQTAVLLDISLTIPKGQMVGIIGPNGAGKSTFLKTILGLQPALTGQIYFLGKVLKKAQSFLSYIPQKETIDWEFPITVKELVMMGRYRQIGIFKWPKALDIAKVDYYLDLVGLTEFKNRQINQLSGGQQQRAFLARALTQEAEIYLMDEPFVGIDAATEKIMIQILQSLVKENKTIFIVHHDLNHIEELFTYLIILNTYLVSQGPLKETFTVENLKLAYGKNYLLLEKALKKAQQSF